MHEIVRQSFGGRVKPGSLLLVDDDPLLRMVLKRRLAALGWTVTAVDSAAAALEVLEARTVSIVLSDVNMPGPSGLDLCSVLQTRANGPPVVLMSGLANAEMRRAALANGAVALFAKPLDEGHLRSLAAEASDEEGAAAR